MVDGKRNMVGLSLPDETLARLAEIAERYGWSRSQTVNKLVEYYDRVSDAWENCQFDPEQAKAVQLLDDGTPVEMYESDEQAKAFSRRAFARNRKILDGIMAAGLILPGTRAVREVEPKMRVETED